MVLLMIVTAAERFSTPEPELSLITQLATVSIAKTSRVISRKLPGHRRHSCVQLALSGPRILSIPMPKNEGLSLRLAVTTQLLTVNVEWSLKIPQGPLVMVNPEIVAVLAVLY